jgi:hypothetical protein
MWDSKRASFQEAKDALSGKQGKNDQVLEDEGAEPMDTE